MGINIIQLAVEHLSDNVIEKLSSAIGTDPDTAKGLIGKAFPALLGSVAEKAETPEGAAQVFSAVNDSDSSILDNLTGFFDGDNSETIGQGQALLTSLLGDKFNSFTDILGAIPGLSKSNASSMMGLLIPILTGLLSKQVKSGGLNIAGLTSLLGDQKQHVTESLGDDFTKKLGLNSPLKPSSHTITTGATGLAAGVAGVVTGATVTANNSASGASKSIKGTATSTSKSVSSAAAAASSKVTGAAAVAATTTAASLKDAAATSTGTVSNVTSQASKTASKAVSGAASSATSGASKAASNAAASAKGAVTTGATKTSNDLLKIIPIVILGLLAILGLKLCKKSDKLSNVSNNITDAVKETGGSFSETANEVGNSIGNAASTTTDSVGNAIGTTTDSLGNTIGATTDTVNDAASATGDSAKNLIDRFTPASEDGQAGTKLSHAVLNLAQQLSSATVGDEAELEKVYQTIGNDNRYTFMYRIPFATGETGVPSAHQATLVSKLKQAPEGSTLVTIGYADTRGDDALNNKLSYGRAKEVGSWITATLSSDTPLESFSMGETDRFSKTDFAKNRVVEVWAVAP